MVNYVQGPRGNSGRDGVDGANFPYLGRKRFQAFVFPAPTTTAEAESLANSLPQFIFSEEGDLLYLKNQFNGVLSFVLYRTGIVWNALTQIGGVNPIIVI